jgi:hypothetical protein
MMNALRNKLSWWVFLFIAITIVFVKVRQVRQIEPFIRESYAISWDIYGYYLYLPATFIYNDVGMQDHVWYDELNSKYQQGRPDYQTWQGVDGNRVNVYPAGTAIFNLPFFIAAHLIANAGLAPADGLSPPYQWAIIFSGLFYGILGMYLLRRLLLHYFSDGISALVLLLVFFGTNLYWYATYDCTMPHVHLFALDVGIILLTRQWIVARTWRTSLLLGAMLGLGVITRPSEIVWVLIPLLWEVYSFSTFRERILSFFQLWSITITLIVGAVAVGGIQLMYWKFTSGNWMSYNHSEGFDFFRPFTLQVLFSFKKGWFLYTPMAILFVAGILFLRKTQRTVWIAVTLFFVFNLWFITSWECWWYAATYGQRPFIQSYGLMALPFGFLLVQLINGRWKWPTITVLCVILLYNQFLMWQFKTGIMHPEFVTKEYWQSVFLQTDQPSAEQLKLLEIDRNGLPPIAEVQDEYAGKLVYELTFEDSSKRAMNDRCIDSLAFNGKYSAVTDSSFSFVGSYRSPYNKLTTKDHIRFKVTARVWMTRPTEEKPLLATFGVLGRRGQVYAYQTIPVRTDSLNSWQYVEQEFVTPFMLHNTDVIMINYWNIGGTTIFVDDFRIEVYEPKRKRSSPW